MPDGYGKADARRSERRQSRSARPGRDPPSVDPRFRRTGPGGTPARGSAGQRWSSPRHCARCTRRSSTSRPSGREAGHAAAGRYGLGWGTVSLPFAPEPLIFHGGSNEMNLAYIFLQPSADFGIVMATNIGGDEAERRAEGARRGALSAFRQSLVRSRSRYVQAHRSRRNRHRSAGRTEAFYTELLGFHGQGARPCRAAGRRGAEPRPISISAARSSS